LNKTNNNNFSKLISNWYLDNGRDRLPWRTQITPYRIWISEIMLQQTQVKTVIPYFRKFIKSYPNLKSLSSASEDDILALWTGLGFYRRAKNIYKTKEIIKHEHKNIFPKKFEELIALPGIGRSTAGAIMSLAFKESYPILDANVKRVISRYKRIDPVEKELWKLSETLTPKNNIFAYTQGIMDVGATVCSIKQPDCRSCPIEKICNSAFAPVINKTSRKQKEKSVKKINFTLAHSRQSFLLFKKEEKTFWESLWVPFDNENLKKEIIFKKPNKTKIQNIDHALSHLDLNITVEIFDYNSPFEIKTNLTHQWVNKDEINNYGLPKPIKTIIENYV
tara:strand:- start:1146 stop:2150 length:1005 start_codon:yes stop_codon:yes gene_type:complete